MSMTKPGYEALAAVLHQAYDQAASGKGHERHAQALPFDQQPMQKLVDLYGQGFALGQAAKKSQESMRLPYERARAELLGGINYLAGAVIALDRQQLGHGGANDNKPPGGCGGCHNGCSGRCKQSLYGSEFPAIEWPLSAPHTGGTAPSHG